MNSLTTTKLDLLIMRIIIKIMAKVLRLKCTKFDSAGRSRDPAGGDYSASPSPLAGLRALLSNAVTTLLLVSVYR